MPRPTPPRRPAAHEPTTDTTRRGRGASSSLAKKPAKPAPSAKPARGEAKPRAAEPARERAPRPAASRPAPAPAPRRPREPGPGLKLLEQALGLVQRREWRGAAELLRRVLAEHAGETEFLDRARATLKVCERSLAEAPRPPRTVEEHYQLGILRLNAGELDQALEQLEKAAQLDRDSDKVQYALAAALAQRGDRGRALERLRRALELNPENRVYAASDSDLELLRDDEEFLALVGSRRGARPAPGSVRPAPGGGADESE